jgi:hypothetical protein
VGQTFLWEVFAFLPGGNGMSKAYRLFKQLLIAVIALAVLTSAWPSVAQSNEPPNQFLEQRLRDPLVYARRSPAMPYSAAQPLYQPNDEDGHDWTMIALASYRDNNWEIYTNDGWGGASTRRTVNGAIDFTPDLNRGCTRITFVSTRNGNYEIHVMNFDGSGVTRLTNTAANEYTPHWSPDGSKIAFYSMRDGNAEIYVMNADGSSQIRLTNNPAWDGHPAWSPDGSKIVFASNRGGYYDLWTMNADGSNVHQLTFGETDAAYPDWSPDGSKIVFDHDGNPSDGFFDIAIVNANGGPVQQISDQVYALDFLGPRWHSTGRFIAFSDIHWVNVSGQWYWDVAYAQARDPTHFSSGSSTWGGLDAAPYNWWPSWQTTDTGIPTSQVTTLPRWTNAASFAASWAGADVGPAGIASYDVQYRDGSGPWTDWLITTTQTSAIFNGAYGHTYYFRSRACDRANNLETYPPGNGDASTTVYQYSLTGQAFGNRDQPISVATVQANPVAMNTALSVHNGTFELYFASGGTYGLTAARSGFSPLPPMLNLIIPNTSMNPIFYLPPIDDQIIDGHFESGDLSAWIATGDITPTITTTAHTGFNGVLLGGTVPSGTLTIAPYHSTIEQTITVPPTLTLGTLSLVYKIAQADPVSDTLSVSIIGPTETLAYSLPLTSSGWTHQWWDVSTWTAPTATVRIELTHGSNLGSTSAVLDDISWGSSNKGGKIVYLPVIYR